MSLWASWVRLREEFEETKAFLERIGFYEMHIFKYSRRAGTRSGPHAGSDSGAGEEWSAARYF